MNALGNTIHIVIPVYNPPETLFRACLASIAKQTHTDFVCVLVDDGSALETAAICDKAATRDFRFTVVRKQNEGLQYARRDGALAALAAGAKYIAFIDSDDTVEPEYLSMMCTKLQETNSDACFCGFNIVCGEKTIVSDWSPSESGTSEDRLGVLASIVGRPHRRFGIRITAWASLYRSALFTGIDWKFTNKMIGEDMRLVCQLMLNVRKVAFIQDRLYNYIQHHASVMHDPDTLKVLNAAIEAMSAVGAFVKQRIPKFDCTADCASREAYMYCQSLDALLDSERVNGRLSRSETDEYVRHVRHALKTPGVFSRLKNLSRNQRVGVLVLNFAGLHAYRLYRLLLKGYRFIRRPKHGGKIL